MVSEVSVGSSWLYGIWYVCLLLVEIRLSHSSTTKHSKEPTHGGLWWGMVYLCRDRGCPLGFSHAPSPSVSPWKKLNHVLSKAKTKASVQSFCFIIKLSLLEPAGGC